MQLMTKEIASRLPALYATEQTPVEAKVVQVKYFGGGRGTWLAVEGERQCQHCGRTEAEHTDPALCTYLEDWLFFGFVVSPLGEDCDEWGYFNLSELAAVRFPPLGLPIERELYFTPKPFSEVRR